MQAIGVAVSNPGTRAIIDLAGFVDIEVCGVIAKALIGRCIAIAERLDLSSICVTKVGTTIQILSTHYGRMENNPSVVATAENFDQHEDVAVAT